MNKKRNTHFKHHFPLIPTCSQPSHSQSILLTPGHWHYPLSQAFCNRLHHWGVATEWKRRRLFTKEKRDKTLHLCALLPTFSTDTVQVALWNKSPVQSGSIVAYDHHLLIWSTKDPLLLYVVYIDAQSHGQWHVTVSVPVISPYLCFQVKTLKHQNHFK